MLNNENIKPTSFISEENTIKDVSLIIPKLKSSLRLQKEFIKEIEEKLRVLADDEVQNKIKLNSSMQDFLDDIPYIIKELGISFAHNFILNSNIYYSLMGIYFDIEEKKDEKLAAKISLIFETCMDVFKFTFSNNELNKNREYLLDVEILKNRNQIIDINPKNEEKIYDNCYVLLNGLKALMEIGKDKEKIEELEKKYTNLKKEIKILSIKKTIESNQAENEFFNELIQEIDACIHFNYLILFLILFKPK